MAKTKMYAVTVEWTERRTVLVDARRPNGAAERLAGQDGWSEAVRYDEDTPGVRPADLRVTDVRAIQ